MARLQTDAEAATACRERATLYEVLAEDLDLPRTGADPSLELE
jgi:hypothetical protein